MIDVACALCGKDEAFVYVFWQCWAAKMFWMWFQEKFHFFIAPLLWKGPLLGNTWMVHEEI
jgi:hypothetical protein